MYVCICNGLKECEVESAVADGADKVGKVFKKHGCKPECKKCYNCIKNVIDKNQVMVDDIAVGTAPLV